MSRAKTVKKKKHTGLIIFLCILALALAIGGTWAYHVFFRPDEFFDTVSLQDDTPPEPSESPEPSGNWISRIRQIVARDSDGEAEDREEKGDKIVNILLMCTDQDYKSYAKDGGDTHTDAMMVVAVNFDKKKVDMISLPRDTITHVPGVRGIYKLNAAINCGGGKTASGYEKVCEAASWLLGGISMDYYCAFELDDVVEIGDLIGGVDFEMDMNYRGGGGYYKKGMQHLDGIGIYDYMRARKNATGEISGDRGRTDRQRRMLKAIFQKLKTQNMITTVPKLISAVDFATNLNASQMASLANFATKIDMEDLGTHVIDGSMKILLGWAFSFPDQENRREIIASVYGLDVPDLPRVSQEYAHWMENIGFDAYKHLYFGQAVIDAAEKENLDTSACRVALDQLQTSYDWASLELDPNYTECMREDMEMLRQQAEALNGQLAERLSINWHAGSGWYNDRAINEIDVDFN